MVVLTPLSRKILEQYQVRKTKKQKNAFISLIQQHFPEVSIQEGGFPRCKNLIIGNIESAKVIVSAHYDTCAQLPIPNFITPTNPMLSILYSVLIYIPVFLAVYILNILLGIYIDSFWVHYFVSLSAILALLLLLVIGPPNKHTANDNTSGVIALCELLEVLPKEERSNAAFIFFDHEETGLIGSAYFRSKYKKQLKDRLLINLDCISDGDYILISANKSARKLYGELLKKAFAPTESKSILFTKSERTYYPSDQIGFPCSIAVAALKKKRFIEYYMDRIHTSRDTILDTENIQLICQSIHKFLKQI